MRRHLSGVVVLAFLAGLWAAVAFSQGGTSTPAVPGTGFRAEYLNQLDGIGKKIISLAEKMPEEKYTWRPGPGVRSVSEVYLHMATITFFYPRYIGTPEPAGFDARSFSTSTTDKTKIVAALKDSFAHAHEALLKVSDADENKMLKSYRGESTYRAWLLYMTEHLGEHLGQSIAYARVNGVVPPWTEEAQRQQQKKTQ